VAICKQNWDAISEQLTVMGLYIQRWNIRRCRPAKRQLYK